MNNPYQQGTYGASPYGGGGGFTLGGYNPSPGAAMPYNMSCDGYTSAVYNSQPHDLRFGGTPKSLYHEYHAMAKQERDPVFRALLRMEADNCYQSWNGTVNMGHYEQTMNWMNGAEKAINKGW